MHIKTIKIENYRSIERVEISLPCHPEFRMCTFVGQNNSGKSNILEAIHILLQKTQPFLDKDDFCMKDTSRTIVFEMMFWEPIVYRPWATWDYIIEVHGIRRERKIGERGKTKGQLIWIYSCLDQSGTVIKKPTRIPRKGETKPPFESMYEIPDEVQENLMAVKLDAKRSLDAHLPDRKRGFFSRALQRVDEAFNDPDRKAGGEGLSLSEKFQKNAGNLFQLLRTKELEDIEDSLTDVLKHFFERDTAFQFDPFTSLDCYEALKLLLSENGLTFDSDRIGDGAQMVMLMGIAFSYHRLLAQNAVFLIEEPEIFLHPHRQRVLHRFLLELAKLNHVFVSTHSTELVDLEHSDLIYRVHKTASTQVSHFEEKFDPTLRKHLRRYEDDVIRRAFFASCVILVEGESDQKALPIYAERDEVNIDLDRHNITVVSAGGKKASLEALAKMFRSLGIPLVVCYDKDTNDEKENERLKNLFPNDPCYHAIELDIKYEDEVRSAMGKSEQEWQKFLSEVPGDGKRLKAIYLASECPIPQKYIDALNKARSFHPASAHPEEPQGTL
jgi:predicted ATP-dependent endonuclease of OLD family